MPLFIDFKIGHILKINILQKLLQEMFSTISIYVFFSHHLYDGWVYQITFAVQYCILQRFELINILLNKTEQAFFNYGLCSI